MFETPEGGDRALLVALDLGEGDPGERLAELTALTVSAGATVVGSVAGRRQRPDAATFAGRGKVDEIAARCVESGADLFEDRFDGRNLLVAVRVRRVDHVQQQIGIGGFGERRAKRGNEIVRR